MLLVQSRGPVGTNQTTTLLRSTRKYSDVKERPSADADRKNSRGVDHLNYSIVEIGQDTEKSPGDLRRLVVTQKPVINHRLTLL